MASWNKDLPRQWSLNTEEIWKNMELEGFFPEDTTLQEPPPQTFSNEIVAGSDTEPQNMTLEGFLTKDTTMQEPPQTVAEGTSGGKGKGRVMEEPLDDEATLKKQRTMIKNRQSAAKSRERKQAYIAQLKSWVTYLKEENARLSREKADMEMQRLNREMIDIQNLDAIFAEADMKEAEQPVTKVQLEKVYSDIKTLVRQEVENVRRDIGRVETKIDADIGRVETKINALLIQLEADSVKG